MIVVCIDIRSTYNIGSILRTCDGFGIKNVYCGGLTPHTDTSDQPPHIRAKWLKEISKTALGAEQTVKMKYFEDPEMLIKYLRDAGYEVVALEQSDNSIPLSSFHSSSENIAIILGSETKGLPESILKLCSKVLEIPMSGAKESFNVSVACGICLYHLK
jgi:tRNA G18 (ribose-2'-O)-methylase SpoU